MLKKLSSTQKSLQHQQFPGGLLSQYYTGSTLLNFSVRMGTGALNVVWSQTNKKVFYDFIKTNMKPELKLYVI